MSRTAQQRMTEVIDAYQERNFEEPAVLRVTPAFHDLLIAERSPYLPPWKPSMDAQMTFYGIPVVIDPNVDEMSAEGRDRLPELLRELNQGKSLTAQ